MTSLYHRSCSNPAGVAASTHPLIEEEEKEEEEDGLVSERLPSALPLAPPLGGDGVIQIYFPSSPSAKVNSFCCLPSEGLLVSVADTKVTADEDLWPLTLLWGKTPTPAGPRRAAANGRAMSRCSKWCFIKKKTKQNKTHAPRPCTNSGHVWASANRKTRAEQSYQ